MDKKIALVTGATRGIGLETVRQLAQLGIHVVFTGRNLEKLAEIQVALKAENLSVEYLLLDVCSSEQQRNVLEHLSKNFGRLDILVNNAGIVPEGFSEGSNFEALSLAHLKETFDTNFFAVFSLTQQLLPLIRKSKAGRIVNVGSKLGSLAMHTDIESSIYHNKTFAYNASKTAVNALTVHLAYHLKDTAIKVNTAHPGWVKTDMGGPEAPLTVEEGAKTSVFLATLPDNGPSGGYFHLDQRLPW
jgi:NAD(P)-dependent dehydrogenase (short-subunit alcohol dehydrogenase family)